MSGFKITLFKFSTNITRCWELSCTNFDFIKVHRPAMP